VRAPETGPPDLAMLICMPVAAILAPIAQWHGTLTFEVRSFLRPRTRMKALAANFPLLTDHRFTSLGRRLSSMMRPFCRN
jgi:hypothetical protein